MCSERDCMFNASLVTAITRPLLVVHSNPHATPSWHERAWLTSTRSGQRPMDTLTMKFRSERSNKFLRNMDLLAQEEFDPVPDDFSVPETFNPYTQQTDAITALQMLLDKVRRGELTIKDFVDARTAEGAEVRDILGIKEAFGNKWPHVKLPVMQFGYSKGVLHRAVALVTNTALGTNQKLVNIMTSATIALFATNPKLDEARFRHVLPEGNDSLPGWLFDRAQAKANKLGYLKPHARVAAWLVAHIIADELYNPAFRGAKLDIDALATLKCDYYDAYSNAPPKAKRTKLRVVASAA